MPQPHKNAPDWQDVYNMTAAIGEEYHCFVRWVTTVASNEICVIGEARRFGEDNISYVVHQALSKRDIRSKLDSAQVHFTIAWDLWCQLDGGGATAAQRGIPYDWHGRPIKPTARKRN